MMDGDQVPLAARQPLPRSVRRALEAMHDDLGRRWTLADLAKIAGVSGRTLQRQFVRSIGRSPQMVRQELGYARARVEFLQGRAGEKVMDVALRCGFPHYGRFAAGYRRCHGETPSETLRRQAVLMAQLAASRTTIAPVRDRPTIAFAMIATDPSVRELADDLAAELTLALTRAGFAVTTQPRAARYRMNASLHGRGGASRLLLQLIDQDSGGLIWAHRGEVMLRWEADSHERLAARVAASLLQSLRRAEIDRALRKPDEDLTAQDLALRAMPGVLSLDADGNRSALELLHQAIARDPRHALATALAAWAYGQRAVYHFGTAPGQDRQLGRALAQRVPTELADATVLCVLGNALTLLDELAEAEQVVGRALALDGGAAWAWSRSGWLDVYRGDAASAIERFRIALDLAPQDPLAFNALIGIGCAHFAAGTYAEAARWQQRGLREHPSSLWVHRTMCPSHVLAGERPEALRSLQALRAGYPDLTLAEVQRGMPPLPDAYSARVFEGLSDAGLPA
ncbi:helix-turn-helix domain-containing protein [Bradyrhizobium sp. SZCCHNRI3043]|uniref:helix-turn-helix domain-containing protein n=1 Tax=Bradyrhizobium sp. SZCCHNRI3043 TaxID=3057292 RepID=UPI0028EA3631|nr:helix-turn-helix domain-containing protein [Bradyrhizobium sp. SZCCHNRI3043]